MATSGHHCEIGMTDRLGCVGYPDRPSGRVMSESDHNPVPRQRQVSGLPPSFEARYNQLGALWSVPDDSDQKGDEMTLQRMDNVLIVVEDLEAAKAFFVELGMELEGETTVEGPSVDRLVDLQNVRATLALMRTPDGRGRIELDKFHTPAAVSVEPKHAPVNTLGIRRIMFAVDDLEDVVARLRTHDAELVGEVVQYEDTYRLCYIRGPEGIIVGLAEQLH